MHTLSQLLQVVVDNFHVKLGTIFDITTLCMMIIISFYSIESTPSPVTPSPSRGRLYLYACSAEISALKTTHDLHVPSVAMNGVVGIAKFNNQTLS